MEAIDKLRKIIEDSVSSGTLKKIIFSRPSDSSVIRTEGRQIILKDSLFIQLETFTKDGKALHKNIRADSAADEIIGLLPSYRQLDLVTTGGNAEARISSKGNLSVIGNPVPAKPAEIGTHDKKKNNILEDGIPYDFLIELGVMDKSGSVFNKKRSKFRQIDRFLHYIDDIYPHLPSEGELFVLDLCCGKSYLTFAAYWYLEHVKERKVRMVGADRKADVIKFCSSVSERLGYSGLEFICCDINSYRPDGHPSLVLSLHACDIATDIVLTTAARLNADVILSTPCCQHQLMSQVNTSSEIGTALSPILEHSLLKQKFCVALTDALRCKRLQASGYNVDVTELIDPEDTPKNLMIRAVRIPMSERKKAGYLKEFNDLQAVAGTDIFGKI